MEENRKFVITQEEFLYLYTRMSMDLIPDDIVLTVFLEDELSQEQLSRILPVIKKEMAKRY